jgi:outer membrane protein assembly factor BamB
VDEVTGSVCTATGTEVMCFCAATGDLRWRSALNNSLGAVTMEIDSLRGVLYQNCDDGLASFDILSGKQIWVANFIRSTNDVSRAAVCNGATQVVLVVVGGLVANYLVGIDASTGSTLYNFTLPDSQGAGPDLLQNLDWSAIPTLDGVAFTGGVKTFYAINCTDPSAKWQWAIPADGGTSSPFLSRSHGVVVFGADDFRVYALNVSSGKTAWSQTTGAVIWSDPIIAGNRVFFGSNDAKLYSICAGPSIQAQR